MTSELSFFYPTFLHQFPHCLKTRRVCCTAFNSSHCAIWKFDIAVVRSVISSFQMYIKDFCWCAQFSPMLLFQGPAFYANVLQAFRSSSAHLLHFLLLSGKRGPCWKEVDSNQRSTLATQIP